MAKITSSKPTPDQPGNLTHLLASMMQTAVHTAVMVDSRCQLICDVNIDLLQPTDLDISLVPEAIFREFILGIGVNAENQLQQENRKARLTGESQCLNVICEHIDRSQHYEIHIRALDANDENSTSHCVWHIREVEPTLNNATENELEEESDNSQIISGNEMPKEKLMYDILEISSDAIIIFDKFQKIIISNPAFKKIIAKNDDDLSSADDITFYNNRQENINNLIWQSLFYENHWSGEVYTTNSDKLENPFWLTVDSFHKDDSLNKNELIASHYLFSLRDISELKETQAALEHSATHDQLTGLPNRAFFLNHLRKAMDRAHYQKTCGALLFIDLDNFKIINDLKGHMVGDVVLLMMATRLKKIFRNGEMIARLGGDEFTLVAEDIQNPTNAIMIAQRILDELTVPFVVEGTQLEIQCSIGISLFPNKSANADEMIKQADIAMYAAKSAGKNDFQLYDSELTKKTTQKFAIENYIRNAIDNNELSMHYQPQFDMKTGKIIGAEALLRWNNEKLGPVSPAVFIPIIESAGMIEEIGHWVLDNVCQQINIWNKFSSMQGIVSVNASRLQLVKSHFVETITDLLNKHGLSGTQLEIEVTENAFTTSEKHMINNLHLLRKMGCKIAIDDFGTGYSSLSNLQSFPLDRLKIDRSFVEKLEYDANAFTIASAIVSLGKSLGLEVIAEGVETKSQIKQLVKMGCRQAQGFYFGRPVSASEFSRKHLSSNSL